MNRSYQVVVKFVADAPLDGFAQADLMSAVAGSITMHGLTLAELEVLSARVEWAP